MQAALLTQCCAKFAGLNIRTKNHCVLRGPTWKMTKNRKNCHISFNFLSNDLVTQNNFNKLKAFCNNSYNCRILFPQHWILKSLLNYLDFVMASLVASSEAQLPLHVLHGKCQETCSFPSNFSQTPFKILGRSKWSI